MRLTLFQMMKIIVGFALASACMLPLVRSAESGMMTWSVVLGLAGIIVPLAFALVTMLIAKRNPFRVCQVWVSCLASSSAAMGFAVYFFVDALYAWNRSGNPIRGRLADNLTGSMIFLALVSLVFAFLLRGSLRSWRTASRQISATSEIKPKFNEQRSRPWMV